MAAKRVSVDDPPREASRRSLLLSAGVLVPPAAWAVGLFALYMLEDFIACTPAAELPGIILGFGVRSIALFLTALLAAATAGAGVTSLVLLLKMRSDPVRSTGATRERWMAVAGIMNSVLFLSIILLNLVPPLLLGACQEPL
jgi:hypothetical protein